MNTTPTWVTIVVGLFGPLATIGVLLLTRRFSVEKLRLEQRALIETERRHHQAQSEAVRRERDRLLSTAKADLELGKLRQIDDDIRVLHRTVRRMLHEGVRDPLLAGGVPVGDGAVAGEACLSIRDALADIRDPSLRRSVSAFVDLYESGLTPTAGENPSVTFEDALERARAARALVSSRMVSLITEAATDRVVDAP